jgi:hypothetical protein
MKTIIQNDKIVIQDPEEALVRQLTKMLSYRDKSKEFQLRRMSNNPFQKNSPQYYQLQNEVNGCLVEKTNSGIVIPSGFAHLLSDLDVDDQRCETGIAVSYPWKKKPFDPRGYQEEAIHVCLNNWRGVINFAMGLGKTLTAVHIIRKVKRKTLVLCPGKGIAKNFYNVTRVKYFKEITNNVKVINV